MPQMAPLNWLSLFLYFIILFLLLNSFLYFNIFNKKELKNMKKLSFKLNWKW